jgi:hypothetical protein
MLRYLALIENPDNGGNPSKILLQDRPLLITIALWALYNSAIIYRLAFIDMSARILDRTWFSQ